MTWDKHGQLWQQAVAVMAAIGCGRTSDSRFPTRSGTHQCINAYARHLNFTGNGCVGCLVSPQQYIPPAITTDRKLIGRAKGARSAVIQ